MELKLYLEFPCNIRSDLDHLAVEICDSTEVRGEALAQRYSAHAEVWRWHCLEVRIVVRCSSPIGS